MKVSLLVRIAAIVIMLSGWMLGAVEVNAQGESPIIPSEVLYVANANSIDLQAAINQVADGGVIELASGTYMAPAGGFTLVNQSKSFTMRAASGAIVVLDGGNSSQILFAQNAAYSAAPSVVVEGITFANGYSASDGRGAISLYSVNFTFVDVTFRNNRKVHSAGTTTGGAVAIFGGAKVFFFNCLWDANYSEDGGAGIGMRDANVYVHHSRFVNNHTVAINSNALPNGSAINIGDGVLWISNTRFEANLSAGHAGAVWVIGSWSKAQTQAYVINSTFIANQIVRNIGKVNPIEGGALVVEDNSYARVYHSRFIDNNADIGGAISAFRCKLEIYKSSFQGNRAVDTSPTSGMGGAIQFNYHDRPVDSSLTIEDTFFQGTPDPLVYDAEFGGGLHIFGILSATRPKVTLRRVVFYDLDVTTISTKAASGGALVVTGVDFLMEDSFVVGSLADGPYGGLGGGMTIYDNSATTIRRTVFADNAARTYGGGLFMQGSNVTLSDCTFLRNEFSPGVQEVESQSYGAAIFAGPDTSQNLKIEGVVENSVFAHNVGMSIFDDDRAAGPINAVVYNGNSFYETSFGAKVYRDSLSGSWTPSELNSGMVSHTGGQPTVDKSFVDNVALPNSPDIAKVRAAPVSLLTQAANGDASQNTTVFITYIWNGSGATLNATPLGDLSGVWEVSTAAAYVLTVGVASASATVTDGATPAFSFSYTSSSPGPIVNWSLTGGTFVNTTLDQGITLSAAPSGAVQLPSASKKYRFYGLTQEGGFVELLDPVPAVLSAPEEFSILIGLNAPNYIGCVPIANQGGQALQWTVQNDSPALLQVTTPGGTTLDSGCVFFQVNPLVAGEYTGTLTINAGAAGSQVVTIYIVVVDQVSQIFLPYVPK